MLVLEAPGGDAAPVVVALAAGKPTNVAVVACLHTLLTLLNALRKRQTRWQPTLTAWPIWLTTVALLAGAGAREVRAA